MIKIESFLPIFEGFYCSIFSTVDEDSDFDNTKEYDYKEYFERVAKSITEFINGELKSYGVDVVFDNLYSPREYNFDNDSINVTYNTNESGIKKINDYIEENKEAFGVYLKERYTGHDGFIPAHSTNVNEWLKTLNDCKPKELKHKFGDMLNFILTDESELTTDDLYEYCQKNGEIYVNELS